MAQIRWFRSLTEDVKGPFVDAARKLAPSILGDLVKPAQTEAHPAAWSRATDRGVVLRVGVPSLSPRTVDLNARLDSGWLAGWWGDEYLFDDLDPGDKESLVVRGVRDLEPHAAEIALQWLADQLARPMNVQQWLRKDRVIAQRWVLTDTEREVARWGKPPLRRRDTPDMTDPVRP
jgi:hypothetical protein